MAASQETQWLVDWATNLPQALGDGASVDATLIVEDPKTHVLKLGVDLPVYVFGGDAKDGYTPEETSEKLFCHYDPEHQAVIFTMDLGEASYEFTEHMQLNPQASAAIRNMQTEELEKYFDSPNPIGAHSPFSLWPFFVGEFKSWSWAHGLDTRVFEGMDDSGRVGIALTLSADHSMNFGLAIKLEKLLEILQTIPPGAPIFPQGTSLQDEERWGYFVNYYLNQAVIKMQEMYPYLGIYMDYFADARRMDLVTRLMFLGEVTAEEKLLGEGQKVEETEWWRKTFGEKRFTLEEGVAYTLPEELTREKSDWFIRWAGSFQSGLHDILRYPRSPEARQAIDFFEGRMNLTHTQTKAGNGGEETVEATRPERVRVVLDHETNKSIFQIEADVVPAQGTDHVLRRITSHWEEFSQGWEAYVQVNSINAAVVGEADQFGVVSFMPTSLHNLREVLEGGMVEPNPKGLTLVVNVHMTDDYMQKLDGQWRRSDVATASALALARVWPDALYYFEWFFNVRLPQLEASDQHVLS